MARVTIEDQALRLLNAFERAGKSVGRVTIDGKKIELVLADSATVDEFDRIDMQQRNPVGEVRWHELRLRTKHCVYLTLLNVPESQLGVSLSMVRKSSWFLLIQLRWMSLIG